MQDNPHCELAHGYSLPYRIQFFLNEICLNLVKPQIWQQTICCCFCCCCPSTALPGRPGPPTLGFKANMEKSHFGRVFFLSYLGWIPRQLYIIGVYIVSHSISASKASWYIRSSNFATNSLRWAQEIHTWKVCDKWDQSTPLHCAKKPLSSR